MNERGGGYASVRLIPRERLVDQTLKRDHSFLFGRANRQDAIPQIRQQISDLVPSQGKRFFYLGLDFGQAAVDGMHLSSGGRASLLKERSLLGGQLARLL